MRENFAVLAVLTVLTACCVIAATPSLVTAQPTPFVINGYVFYANGTACNAPNVSMMNTDNGRDLQAENYSTSNYYRLVLANGTDLNASETLRFEIGDGDGSQSKTFSNIINETEVNAGGIFYQNVTLVEPPATPFIVWGWGSYDNGNPCENLSVNITNLNTSKRWNAETHTGYNFYQLAISSSNVSAGNTLEINATDGVVFNVTNHIVTSEEMGAGGFEQNVTLTILPIAPTVESITITPDDDGFTVGVQIDPVPGGNKTGNITVVVSDGNGWEDIDSVVAVLTGPSTISDSPVILTFVSNSSETTATFEGSFNMSFYYTSGDYIVNVTATDNSSLTGSGIENFTYTTCIGLSIDAATVNFGSVNPGESSSVPGDESYVEGSMNGMTIKNTGNVEIDLNPIEASDMSGSSGGTIANDNLYCGFTAGDYGVNLGSPTSYDLNLDAGDASYNLVNFRLTVPTGTAVGSYSGNITMTAELSS